MNFLVKGFNFLAYTIGLVISTLTIMNVVAPYIFESNIMNESHQYIKPNAKMHTSSIFTSLEYLSLHTPDFNYEPLEVQEVVLKNKKEYQPNYTEQSVLLINCDWAGDAHGFLMDKLVRSGQDKDKEMGVFLIQQKNNYHYYDEKSIRNYAKNIMSLIEYLIQSRDIKKLSIFGYEQGALVIFMALSQAKISSLLKISKVFLVNPFSPHHILFQNDNNHLKLIISSNIVSNPQKLKIFNQLRIVIINTFQTTYPYQPQLRSWFHFTLKDKNGHEFQLNSTLFISSKYLWNIRDYYIPARYLSEQMFISLIGRIFNQDRKSRLSILEIDTLLRYKEARQKLMPASKQKKCQLIELEWICKFGFIQVDANPFHIPEGCSKFVIKKRHLFTSSTLLIYSQKNISVYGPKKEKFSPTYVSKTGSYQFIFTLLENFNQFYVINSHSKAAIFMNTIHKASAYPIIYKKQGQAIMQSQQLNGSQIAIHGLSMYETCQGGNEVSGIENRKAQVRAKVWEEGDCYIEVESDQSFAEYVWINWPILKNLIILGMFTTHILKLDSFERFFSQLQAFILIYYIITGNILIIEPAIAVSMSASFEGMIKVLNKLSQTINIAGDYNWIGSLVPITIEICIRNNIGVKLIGNSFKMLSAQIAVAHGPSGYIITYLKFYFILDIYSCSMDPMYSLMLLAAWQFINQPNLNFMPTSKAAQSKRWITDRIFLLAMVVCVTESIGALHQCLNFYMIAHILLAAEEKFKKSSDKHYEIE